MPDFKLFGKTINVSSLHQNHQYTDMENSVYEEETTTTTTTSSISGANKKPKTSSLDAAEIESLIQTTPEKFDAEDEEEKEKEKQKHLKKPGKILACPRCKSTDTKFCYYNNYNVNQPRHLCKKCQRYWTAGGSIWNIPVGAGRRKSKTSAFRHMMLSESIRFQAVINGLQDPYLVTNNSTSFITFGRDQTRQALGQSNQKFTGKVSAGIFNGFSPSLMVLQSNPAALCRSLDFHESN